MPPTSMPPAVTPLAIVSLREESYAHAPATTARSRPTTTATIRKERFLIGANYPERSGGAHGIVAHEAAAYQPGADLQAGLQYEAVAPQGCELVARRVNTASIAA